MGNLWSWLYGGQEQTDQPAAAEATRRGHLKVCHWKHFHTFPHRYYITLPQALNVMAVLTSDPSSPGQCPWRGSTPSPRSAVPSGLAPLWTPGSVAMVTRLRATRALYSMPRCLICSVRRIVCWRCGSSGTMSRPEATSRPSQAMCT